MTQKQRKKIALTLTGLIILGVTLFFFKFEYNKRQAAIQAPLFDNLGTFHRPISTKNSLAQRYFDQGLVLFYGFQWGESIRSFKQSAVLDPSCALCHWGHALALITNINDPASESEFAEGQAAIQQALTYSSEATAAEQALINALALRYLHAPQLKGGVNTFSCHAEDDNASNQDKTAYSNAMRKIVHNFPEDLDAKALYASFLYFNIGEAKLAENSPELHEAATALKEVLKSDPNHVGANHFFIHITEPYKNYKEALTSANVLQTLVPGSEHLVHMPSHIYSRMGRYQAAVASNLQAIKTYDDYIQTCLAQGFEPFVDSLYLHNFDFLRSMATMQGNKALALDATNQMLQQHYQQWLETDASFQWFTPIPYFVKARFGLWEELLNEPAPANKYGYALGMWHYGRGFALARTNQIEDAKQQAQALEAIIAEGETENNLETKGIQLLQIAHAVLVAILADLEEDKTLVFDSLHKALALQDSLEYREPQDWYFSLRVALGDAYVKWGQFADAEKMYREDLRHFPHNGWALYGLIKSIRAQDKKVGMYGPQFSLSWKHADIPAPIPVF